MASLPSIPSLPSLPGLPMLPAPGDLLPVSAPEIAAGTFSAGAKDEIAAADIYSLKSSVGGKALKPITSIQELRAGLDEVDFNLTLDAGIANDFMSKTKEGLTFDKDILTARILGTSTEFKSAFNELNETMKKGAMQNAFKDKANSLMCTVGDVKSMVNASKISDVRSLGAFVNKYTGTKMFSGQDKGAMAGLLGSVITTASNLGIPGAFKAIADTVNDPGIMGRVTRAVLPIALRNSDVKVLREMATGPAASLMNVFAPGFTQNFAKAFTYRGDRATSLDSFEDIFGAFRGANAQWDQMQRGGGSALDLLSLMGGSRDFRNLVMTGVKYWANEQSREGGRVPNVPIDPMYAFAAAYQEITVGQAIKRDFPKVALLSVYNQRLPKRTGLPAGTRNPTNNHVVDARLIRGSVGALLGL